MKEITKQMLRIYKPISGLDWLNYKLKRSEVTFHHITKKVDNGRTDLSNGCLLTKDSHAYVHLVECLDIETYLALTQMFRIINNQLSEPNDEQREQIEKILREFENTHKWDKSPKGKLLIKKKYLQRDFILPHQMPQDF